MLFAAADQQPEIALERIISGLSPTFCPLYPILKFKATRPKTFLSNDKNILRDLAIVLF